MSRGHDRERDLRELLRHCGWVVLRAAGSLGPVDVAAFATDHAIYPAAMGRKGECPAAGDILFIEVKSTRRPFERFGPSERGELLEIADSVHAEAWLAHKPSGASRWTWTPSSAWPAPSGSPAAQGSGTNLPNIHREPILGRFEAPETAAGG